MSQNNYQYPITNMKPFNPYNNHMSYGQYDSGSPMVSQFQNMNLNSNPVHQNNMYGNDYPTAAPHMPPNLSSPYFSQNQNAQLPNPANLQPNIQPTGYQSIPNSNSYENSQFHSDYTLKSNVMNDPNANKDIYSMGMYPPGMGYQSVASNSAQMQSQPAKSFSPIQPPSMSLPPSSPPIAQNQGSRFMNSTTQSLNPESMPSAVQVIELDKTNNASPYGTGSRDRVPPLVTTDFVAIDQGTCNPKFIRSSLYVIPTSPDMLKNLHIPFVLSICPFAKLSSSEQPIVCGEFSEKGPVRCIRCKAYMSPLMTFIDGGRRFQCNICGGNSEVNEEYFAHLDQNGRRIDCFNRPELCLGSYELLATKEYCRNDTFPKPPAFIFMLDVSYSSVKSGLLTLFCNNLKDQILPYLATDPLIENSPKPLVGFITYDRVLHFYNLKSNMTKPQMHVISYLDNDSGSELVPLVNGFLVDPVEAIDQIAVLMENIIETFSDNEERNVVLGPAIEAGMEALKASGGCSGKLFIFHSSLPSADAPGRLKARDDRTVLGTDKEKNLFSCGSVYYTKLGEACVESGVSVDLFLTPSAFIDVSTLSELPRLTCGNLFKYDFFSPLNHGAKFLNDLQHSVSAPCAFDAIMRVRTSLGTRTVDYLGNFMMKNTEDVQMACIDSGNSVMVEIKHNDKLQENESVNIQVAVLYTGISGQRRLRIHNLSFNVSSNILDVFKLTDLDTLMNWMSRNAVRTFQTKSVKDVRDEVSQKSAQILASYRRNYAEQSKPAELVLPENLKLLPLYANSLLKCDFMQSDCSVVPVNYEDSGTDLSTDERAYQCFLLNEMDVKHSQVFLYPRLLPLTTINPESNQLPIATRASYTNLASNGVYLIENGINIIIWIGQNVDSSWLQNVFNCSTSAEITNRSSFPILNSDLSRAVNKLVQIVRSSRSRYMMLNMVIQGDKTESAFKKFLVEDRGERGNSSYVDFLCFIHKEIRNILNY